MSICWWSVKLYLKSMMSYAQSKHELELNTNTFIRCSIFSSSQMVFEWYIMPSYTCVLKWTWSFVYDQLPMLMSHLCVSYGNMRISIAHKVSKVPLNPQSTMPVDVNVTVKSLDSFSKSFETLYWYKISITKWMHIHYCNKFEC